MIALRATWPIFSEKTAKPVEPHPVGPCETCGKTAELNDIRECEACTQRAW